MLYFSDVPGANQTTNATPNTANDCMFVTPGASRTCWVTWCQIQGKAGGLTALSGIIGRLEKWPTTASSAGTAITPGPTDDGYQAAKHSAAYSASTVTSGTGTLVLLAAFGCSVSGPGGWGNPQAATGNVDNGFALQAGATKSIDLFNASGSASLNFETGMGVAE